MAKLTHTTAVAFLANGKHAYVVVGVDPAVGTAHVANAAHAARTRDCIAQLQSSAHRTRTGCWTTARAG
jgi:hypothetical protein